MHPVLDQGLDGDHLQFVTLGELGNSARSAIVPSSFMISQMTPADTARPTRARSTDPSVCPARLSTPDLRLEENMPDRASPPVCSEGRLRHDRRGAVSR